MLHSYKKIAANQGALYDSKKRNEVRKQKFWIRPRKF